MPPGMTLIVENRSIPEQYHANPFITQWASEGSVANNNCTPTGLSDRDGYVAVLLLC